MISKHGARLLSDDAGKALLDELVPHAFLLIPNLPEAAALTGRSVETIAEMKEAARFLAGRGAQAVLVKGGHSAEPTSTDILFYEGVFTEFAADRIHTRNTHGTGCTYSAAITGLLATGLELRRAILQSKRFITEAIKTNPGLGKGAGPVNHWV
jgi:hydroxymethylpyrimidine kinase/phosphomethylpyrimidine kinase